MCDQQQNRRKTSVGERCTPQPLKHSAETSSEYLLKCDHQQHRRKTHMGERCTPQLLQAFRGNIIRKIVNV